MTNESPKVNAIVLHAAKDLRFEQRQLSECQPDELQVQVSRTGLCGSDLHYFNHFANGDIKVREPLILGHESAGVVVQVGSAVSSSKFAVGDRVALEVGVPCEACEICRRGRYNLCTKMRFRSSAKSFPHFQGTLQDRINHPARWCHKLPESMSLEVGALLEPLAVALHAVERATLQNPPARVSVIGAGAVGLLVAKCLKSLGHKVVISDLSAARVQFATTSDIADIGVVLPMKLAQSIEEKLELAQANKNLICDSDPSRKETNAEKATSTDEDLLFDATFECTGVEGCVQTAIYSTSPGGKVVLVGMGQPIQTLQLSAAALREVDLVGVFRYAGNYDQGIQMIQQGLLDGLEKLITHRFRGLHSAESAFDMARRAEDENKNLVLKVMIES